MLNFILLVAFMALPLVATVAWIGVMELRDRAWQAGFDTAWDRAVKASNNGVRII